MKQGSLPPIRWDPCPSCGNHVYREPYAWPHECPPVLAPKRTAPGLYRIDNGLQVVMAHGTLFLRFPAWMGNTIWRWRQHSRARRRAAAPTFPSAGRLPNSAEGVVWLLDQGYREHEAYRASIRYKGVDVVPKRFQS